MVRFIFACAAFIVLSMALTPVYYGIKNTKDKFGARYEAVADNTAKQPSPSFEDIYEMARNNDGNVDPAMLNAIVPAAGQSDEAQDTEQSTEKFSNGFSGETPSALAD